jgi:hypothetical protein
MVVFDGLLRTSSGASGNPSPCGAHGGGEPDVGLHAHPGCAEERRASRRRVDNCSNSEGTRHAVRFWSPTSWQAFLRAHWGAIAGADFFTTEVWTWRGLITRRLEFPHPELVLFVVTFLTSALLYLAERLVEE